MRFEEALGIIKSDRSKCMYLSNWEEGTYVYLGKMLCSNLEVIQSFIMNCRYGTVPWIPNMQNMVLDDWLIKDNPKRNIIEDSIIEENGVINKEDDVIIRDLQYSKHVRTLKLDDYLDYINKCEEHVLKEGINALDLEKSDGSWIGTPIIYIKGCDIIAVEREEYNSGYQTIMLYIQDGDLKEIGVTDTSQSKLAKKIRSLYQVVNRLYREYQLSTKQKELLHMEQGIHQITTEEGIDFANERIVMAAIRIGDKYIYSVRHWDNPMRYQVAALGLKIPEARNNGDYEEGFITNKYNFINRELAKKLAVHNGQYLAMLSEPEKEIHPNLHYLFSEDLY